MPVVDLRIKFNCTSMEYNDFTVVIVLNARGRVVGAVVDSVSDVLELAPAQISAASEMNTSVDTSYLTRTAKRMLVLMDASSMVH